MSYGDISTALDSYFGTFNTGGADVAWEGRVYDPTEGTPYFSVRLAGYSRYPLGYGPDAYFEERGTYQISVHRPASEGRAHSAVVADSVVAFFRRGLTISTSGGQTVIVESASAMPAEPSGAWMTIPVVVQWSACAT